MKAKAVTGLSASLHAGVMRPAHSGRLPHAAAEPASEPTMKVCVIGAGYVGLVTAACLAEMGNSVACLDVDGPRVEALRQGRIPIHEPGLDEMVQRNAGAGRLFFTTDAERAVGHGTIVFIAVGTPAAEDGSADLDHVLAAAATVGRHMGEYKVVVDKSTVPVGTADRVREAVAVQLRQRDCRVPFSVASNPEFLKEGAAVDDFMRPDRVIVGADDDQAILLLRALYAPFLRNRDRLLVMDLRSAEMTKYAANAMLATRISFMNEMALLAERLGADIEKVRLGIGSDPRIGSHFLYAGLGWGGSCFPKDVKALRHMGSQHALEMPMLEATERINQGQRRLPVQRLTERLGASLQGHVVAVWGLAFKPGTDDLREAPALAIIDDVLARGGRVRAFDPVAMPALQDRWGPREGLELVSDAAQACEGASALVVATEWREFRSPDWAALRPTMARALVFDGRNLYDGAELRALGFEHVGIGRAEAAPPDTHARMPQPRAAAAPHASEATLVA
jgi:UDPglucose 6-dehydrogenase